MPPESTETKPSAVKPIWLSPRQRQLAKLVAEGLQNKEIAFRLGLSEGTIKVYCSALYTKLGVSNRAGAASWATHEQDKAEQDIINAGLAGASALGSQRGGGENPGRQEIRGGSDREDARAQDELPSGKEDSQPIPPTIVRIAEFRFHIDPKTGSWFPVPASDESLPYVSMERHPLREGDTYIERTPAGIMTGRSLPFPADQTHQVVAVWHMPNGDVVECPHYGPAGIPYQDLPDCEPEPK